VRGPPPARQHDLVHVGEIDQPGGPLERLLLLAVVAFGTRQTLASYLSMHTGPDTTASAGHFESGALGGPEAPAALASSASAIAIAIPFDMYADAVQTFAHVLDTTPKFFLHWYWRMNAQLGLTDAWLAAGNLRNARTEADRFLDAASSTSEPNLLALRSDVQARVAMAAKDWKRAERHIESALAIVAKFDIPTVAWRVHATRSDLARSVKDEAAAEQHRARAEAVVVALAEFFDRDEPLRHAFLSAPPVRRLGTRRENRAEAPRKPMKSSDRERH
jgi:hypothetical protein